jgi:hypothetical protein
MQFTSQLEQGDWYIVASWLCVVIALLLYGIGIVLAKMRRAWGRARAKRKRAHALAALARYQARGAPSPRTATSAPPQTAAGPTGDRHWSSVAAIVEAGLAGVEAASDFHAKAGRHIDAAEYALNRLIADLVNVMPRSQPAPAEPARAIRLPRPPPAAEPLAA